MSLVDNVVEFIETNLGCPEKDTQKLRTYIQLHFGFNTILVLKDSKGITAVARWNEDEYGIAHILECAVRKDKRSYGFIKSLIAYGLSKYPHIKKMVWEREIKYPNRKQKEYCGKHND